ncbi:MAG: hypothetical protein IKQ44_00965 [Lachnospiraceae bacterium]|nr:hypothetical protein [Lachnospiraceae bacterium]
MRYTDDEVVREILRRSKKISYERRKKRDAILIAATVMFAICASGIILLIPVGNKIYDTRTLYGSFLLNPSTGGYILVALIAFVIGIAVAIICKRYQNEPRDFKD